MHDVAIKYNVTAYKLCLLFIVGGKTQVTFSVASVLTDTPNKCTKLFSYYYKQCTTDVYPPATTLEPVTGVYVF